MLDTQVIKNTQEIPEWEKDIIDARLEMVQNQSERLKPIEKLFEIL